MAWRIGEYLERAEIDNRVRGEVEGYVLLRGSEEPILLKLAGDCWRDMAGRRFVLEGTGKEICPADKVPAPCQEGTVGDMTSSRKVRAFTIPVNEALASMKRGGKPPEKMANSLYLEWYSEANGRVVLETVNFRIAEMSDVAWKMSEEDEREQHERSQKAMGDFMNQVELAAAMGSPDWTPEDDEPMDEFKWEQFLRESDKGTEKYGELLEKYDGHPDQERLVAREMGWNRLDDLLDADSRGLFDKARAEMNEEPEPDPEPDPATEGVDWVRTESGYVKHPLVIRAQEASMAMWKRCKERGLMEEDGEACVREMTFQFRMIATKLAGALNSLAYRSSPDPGFVVAYLKRALGYFNPTMEALQQVEEKNLVSAAELARYRQDLFELREAILDLMQRFRAG